MRSRCSEGRETRALCTHERESPFCPEQGFCRRSGKEQQIEGRRPEYKAASEGQLSPCEARQRCCSPGLAGRAEAPIHGRAAAQGERRPQAAAGSREDGAERSGGVICGTRPGPPPPPAAAAGAPRRQRRPGPTPAGEGRLPAGGPPGWGGPVSSEEEPSGGPGRAGQAPSGRAEREGPAPLSCGAGTARLLVNPRPEGGRRRESRLWRPPSTPAAVCERGGLKPQKRSCKRIYVKRAVVTSESWG